MELNAPLTTDRLILRSPALTDAPFIRSLLTDRDVRRFLGGPVPDQHLKSIVSEILTHNPETAYWLVMIKTDQSPIGLVSIMDHHDGAERELSYQFKPAAWGMGFSFEAASCVLHHAINNCGIVRLISETQSANTASRRLLARLGMEETAQVYRFGAAQVIYATGKHSLVTQQD